MATKVYRLSSAFTADGNVAVDIRDDGFITSMVLDLDCPDAGGALDGLTAELGMSSVASATETALTNDVMTSLLAASLHVVGANVGMCSKVSSVSGLRIPVFAGERLFLHVDLTSVSPARALGYVYVDHASLDDLGRVRDARGRFQRIAG